MNPGFRISRRHYDIIIKQALDNLPKESGGFLGGKDGVIQAILPLFNFHLGDRTNTFTFTAEDLGRAHQFFKKHNLDYIGMYHTHPSGNAYPSQADISTGHRYHFIIGAKDESSVHMRAFEVVNNQPTEIQLSVISGSQFSAKDLYTGNIKEVIRDPLHSAAEELSEKMDNIRHQRQNNYNRLPPNRNDSDFSTLA